MQKENIVLRSPAFSQGGTIPSKYTCDGEDISPPISIDNLPKDTISFVIIMDDPDAPKGTWDHWVVFNINPDIGNIGEGSEPEGMAGINSWNRNGYGGPCPPDGEHRYFFKIYALDTKLALPKSSTKNDILSAMKGHILAEGELIGVYERGEE